MQDALGLTCDWVYWWRLLLEEYGPKIVYVKGIDNTVANVISRLDFGPSKEPKANWMTFTKCWCVYNRHDEQDQSPTAHKENMNFVFANCSNEDAIYPFTVKEIATSQSNDKKVREINQAWEIQISTSWKHSGSMQGWQACHPTRTSVSCGWVVSPLPATPRAHSSGRDSSFYDVLEWHVPFGPFLCQKVS